MITVLAVFLGMLVGALYVGLYLLWCEMRRATERPQTKMTPKGVIYLSQALISRRSSGCPTAVPAFFAPR